VYKWLFEAIGWTLCAKPDKVEFVVEDGREIMEITDYKSGNSYEYTDPRSNEIVYRPKRKHKEQIFFFALVVSLAQSWTGPIRLKIRYWGNKAECQPMWFSHRRTDERLDEVARQIKLIEGYLAAHKFPAKPGFWCKDCPLSSTCAANVQYKGQFTRPVTLLPLPQPAAAS